MDAKIDHITVTQAANMSGKSTASIYNAIKKGDLHWVIVMGDKMLARGEFECWVSTVKIGRPKRHKPHG